MSEQPKLIEMWKAVGTHGRGEQGDFRNLLAGFVLFAVFAGGAISVLMEISGASGMHPIALVLILLVFGYVVWSLMKKLPRA